MCRSEASSGHGRAFLLPLVNVFVNEVGGDPCAQSPRGLLTGTPDSRLVLVILAANLACKLVATLNNCVSRRSPGSAHRPLCGRSSGKPAGRWAPGGTSLSPAAAHQIWDFSQDVAPVCSVASVLLWTPNSGVAAVPISSARQGAFGQDSVVRVVSWNRNYRGVPKAGF